MKLRLILVATLILVIFLAVWIARNPSEYEKTDTAMDTLVSIRAYGWGAKNKVNQAMERIKQIEQRMSVTVPTSDVSRINTGDTYWGNQETMRVINRGIYYGEQSAGVFDISIKPLTDLYAKKPTPSTAEIQSARALINHRNLVMLKAIPKDMGIDLGAIAKGYAGDEAALSLKRNGITDSLINMGGDIVASGSRKWKIGLQNPFEKQGKIMGTLEVVNKSVATSGEYERGAHIYDPRTGRPVDNDVAGATVIASSGMDADALSTILFILGREGLPLIEKLGGKGIIITKNSEVITSPDIKLKITDKKFKLI